MSMDVPSCPDPTRGTRKLTTNSIELRRGQIAFFDGKKFSIDSNDFLYAPSGSIIVGKNLSNDEDLNAHGSPCKVVAFYNSRLKTGALIHIDCSDIKLPRHKELIDILLSTFPQLVNLGTKVIVCGDAIDCFGGTGNNGVTYEFYHNDILEYVRSKGITSVEIFSEGVGKDVYLYTDTGKIVVEDDDGFVIKQSLMK